MPHAVVTDRQRNGAKQLRQAMMRAETLRWRYIKANRIDDVSFRRQVPVQNYMLDRLFFVPARRAICRRGACSVRILKVI
jgi:very-short-patch-repair endonuclease